MKEEGEGEEKRAFGKGKKGKRWHYYKKGEKEGGRKGKKERSESLYISLGKEGEGGFFPPLLGGLFPRMGLIPRMGRGVRNSKAFFSFPLLPPRSFARFGMLPATLPKSPLTMAPPPPFLQR